MNETDATQQQVAESRTIELFQVERREYTDQHGFSRREPFKVNAKMVTIQEDGTAKDEHGNIYRRSRYGQSKWISESYVTWRSAYSGHLGEV